MSRVVYEKNPLYEVTLQVKFPAILHINSEAPAVFQDRIKSKFPIYRQEVQNEQEISLFPNECNIPPLFRNISSNKNHLFISENGQSKVCLTSSFVSLSTLKYERWEVFFAQFKDVFLEFQDIYKQNKFNRVGLRYIDVFDREILNLKERKWSELIESPWIGSLTADNENKLTACNVNEELILDEGTRRRVSSGLTNKNGVRCFVIDSDFIYMNQSLFEDWERKCFTLHNYSDDFYQTTTTELLKNAMVPLQEG